MSSGLLGLRSEYDTTVRRDLEGLAAGWIDLVEQRLFDAAPHSHPGDGDHAEVELIANAGAWCHIERELELVLLVGGDQMIHADLEPCWARCVREADLLSVVQDAQVLDGPIVGEAAHIHDEVLERGVFDERACAAGQPMHVGLAGDHEPSLWRVGAGHDLEGALGGHCEAVAADVFGLGDTALTCCCIAPFGRLQAEQELVTTFGAEVHIDLESQEHGILGGEV